MAVVTEPRHVCEDAALDALERSRDPRAGPVLRLMLDRDFNRVRVVSAADLPYHDTAVASALLDIEGRAGCAWLLDQHDALVARSTSGFRNLPDDAETASLALQLAFSQQWCVDVYRERCPEPQVDADLRADKRVGCPP